MNPPADSELKTMQDEIYREKILRARKRSPEERLADVFSLTNAAFQRMHEGAMWQAGITDEEEGWKIVRERLARLRNIQEAGRYVHQPPNQPS